MALDMKYDVQIGVFRELVNGKNLSASYSVRLTENGVKISESVNSYSNTCSIFVPKKNSIKNNDYSNYPLFQDFASDVKKGDAVNIRLLYEESDFKGIYDVKYPQFIVSEVVIGKNEIEIKCLDIMFFLINSFIEIPNGKADSKGKEQPVFVNLKDIGDKLIEVANAKIDEYNKRGDDSIFGFNFKYPKLKLKIDNNLNFNLRFKNGGRLSGTEVLKILEKDYMVNSQIIVVDDNNNESESPLKYYLQIGINWDNIQKDGSEDYLAKTYFSEIPQSFLEKAKKNTKLPNFYKIIDRENLVVQKYDDVKLRVKAIIIDINSNKKEYEAKNSDADGQLRTFTFFDKLGNMSSSTIEKLLDAQLAKLKYDGFKKGSTFKTFGYPRVIPNQLITFDGVGTIRNDRDFQDNIQDVRMFLPKQTFFVNSVETSFDNNGWRQEIEISFLVPKVDEFQSIIDLLYPDQTFDLDSDEQKQKMWEDIVERQNRDLELLKSKNDSLKIKYKTD